MTRVRVIPRVITRVRVIPRVRVMGLYRLKVQAHKGDSLTLALTSTLTQPLTLMGVTIKSEFRCHWSLVKRAKAISLSHLALPVSNPRDLRSR